MVERDLGVVSEEEMQEIAARSRVMQVEQFPDIGWERSHVCSDDDGALKAFCVYVAPSPERLKEHTDSVGGLVITNIYEIVGDLAPDGVHDVSLGSGAVASLRAWNKPWYARPAIACPAARVA